MTEIVVLYFDGCPSWQRAWSEPGVAIAKAGVDASVRLRNVQGVSDQLLRGFGGSPTMRIDGRDLEGYEGLPLRACRRYVGNDGRGWPSQSQLQEALRRAEAERAGVGA